MIIILTQSQLNDFYNGCETNGSSRDSLIRHDFGDAELLFVENYDNIQDCLSQSGVNIMHQNNEVHMVIGYQEYNYEERLENEKKQNPKSEDDCSSYW